MGRDEVLEHREAFAEVRHNGRLDNLAHLAGGDRDQTVVQHRHLHAGACFAAGADVGVGAGIVGRVHVCRQHGDAAGHLAQAEILHQHGPEFLQRQTLVGAVHGRAGIDHETQRRVVVLVHRRVLNQHLDDGGHGEQVIDAVLLHQLPDRLGIELLGRQQHGGRTARHIEQRMDAGAV